jgi:DNA invertase Pin-like site-specific DNA recombinase
MRALGYVRVSTEEQAQHGVSLDAQRERIGCYAKLYDLEVIEVFVDDGWSGDSLERPGLRDALSALEDGEAEAIIVAKLDRLSRNVRELLDLIAEHFSERFTLLSVAEQLDARTATGRFTITILAAVAQLELETIRERTREALAYKRGRGEYTGGQVPYGWRLGEDGILIANDAEQAAVDKARTLRRQGLPLRTIAVRLCEAGHYPRNGARRWAPTQVMRLVAEQKGA